MLEKIKSVVIHWYQDIDWWLILAVIPVVLVGLITMGGFDGPNYHFDKQVVSLTVSVIAFFILASIDFRFLRRTSVIVGIFLLTCAVLIALFVVGHTAKGAQSWFRIGSFAFEPGDPSKLVVILLLAKYFSRRHIEIANIRHILVSGLYAGIIFFLIVSQPDFGSAVIIFFIWLGMVMVSGISKKHLAAVGLLGVVCFSFAWVYVLAPYQQARIMNFLHPLANIRGSGYNAYQSMIAVGSGEIVGKGIGYGTQSRLNFLPEYQTDFIFAAFAEEWGFIGSVLLVAMFVLILWRILISASMGATNFEVLYGVGLAVFFTTHLIINLGMNVGLLPVTGITVPFMSYGGTHLLTEFVGLGILMGMRKYRRQGSREIGRHEINALS